MGIYAIQRNATRNQSTVDYNAQNVFTYGNRYQQATFVNNLGESLDAQDGILVYRNAGTYETAVVRFSATSLTAGQTMIIAGLTYTSTGTTTQAQLAAAFANLAVGATTGAGTATGSYSGTLTGYSTGAVLHSGTDVLFTASTVGNKTDLTQSGTGASVTSITIQNGTSGTLNAVSPITSTTVGSTIGILKMEGINTMADGTSMLANVCIDGDIDASMLILPTGVTLDTIVSGKALRDILTTQGFVLNNVIEGTKFNN
jgi:hypothetical protein